MEIFRKYLSIKNIIFFIIAILFLIFLSKIKDIAILFFASYVIACSLKPLVKKKTKKMSRPMASAIVLVGAILVVLAFFVPIFVMGGIQIRDFMRLLPAHLTEIKMFIAGLPFINAEQLSNLNYSELASTAGGITTDILDKSIVVSKGIAAALIYILAGCLITYYFLADEKIIRKTYLTLFPKHIQNKADEIITSISQKVGGYVVAQIVTIASVGIIVSLGLLILRDDYAILLGLMAGLFDLVPVVGPTVAFIVILLAVYKLSALKIGLVIFIFLFAQWAENNLVRPYIFSKFMDLHPLIIYFFLLVTAQYLGIVGVIFAPPIAATVCVLIEELYIKNIK